MRRQGSAGARRADSGSLRLARAPQSTSAITDPEQERDPRRELDMPPMALEICEGVSRRDDMRSVLAAMTAALGLALLAGAMPAIALERGATEDGWPYLAGGFGIEERDQLEQARREYRLRVTTAARGSGAYLSGVRLRIADASGRSVFDREIAGPWLLIDVAPGRYSLRATLKGETVEQQVTLGATDRREIYFYFPVAAEVPPWDERLLR
jgi:hypothetical protein